jgi:Fe-S-cluster-containing dehydrogenase component/Ni/Fe-hydrogenase subunit HybB-like protein
MQLGFVIDQSRCIGCHACTVACKSENEVPVGSFRTWVKYTEKGEFPSVRRSFSVMRCNQCTDAPCVTICPTGALEKRLADGIVDLDKDACIGCKSCMQGCPYDALYINEEHGTAEKCHFCAHRTELGLAPACAVVCPTEAIIPGDFADPTSLVSRLVARGGTTVRKPEAGTRPNVHYVAADAANLDPTAPTSDKGFLWSNRRPGMDLAAAEFAALEKRAAAGNAAARTTYDVDHPPLWGWKISAYLLTKSAAAGVLLAALLPALLGIEGFAPSDSGFAVLAAVALFFLALTSVLLVTDLKRPERFLYILLRPNSTSWLVRGTWFLMGYGALATAWLALGVFGAVPSGALFAALGWTTCVLAALAACYTGWLFGQSKGRVLWMRRGLWAHFIVQAGLVGTSLLVLVEPLVAPGSMEHLRVLLAAWLFAHLVFILGERFMAPKGREAEYRRTVALVEHGPFAFRHWSFGVLMGVAAPLLLCLLPGLPLLAVGAALFAIMGVASEEDLLVRAGQALPIS